LSSSITESELIQEKSNLYADQHINKKVRFSEAYICLCTIEGSQHGRNKHYSCCDHTYRSSERKVTQIKKYHFSGEVIELLFCFVIRVFKIEESETANTYVGKKAILYT
jgi:hypothetical protein